MKKDINTDIMFATPIGYTELPIEVCDMFKPLKGLVQSKSSNNPKYYNVLKDNEKLKQDLTDIFSLWVNNTYNYPDQKWKMLTNWITDNPEGEPMRRHRHFNCMFSAVLYFDEVKDGEGNLILENPQDSSDFFPTDGTQVTTIFSNRAYTCPLQKGLLLFFPANVSHTYLGFKPAKKLRRSFACNFVPIGKYGIADSFMDTNWLSHDG
tara:strand:+ start:144 stop:767 length:624 start_codon:yes stop_codon:yes gene_type:complete